MKTSLFICLFSLLAVFGYSEEQPSVIVGKQSSVIVMEFHSDQQPTQDALKQRIQAHRVAFFTERLALTPAEAEKFWSLYNTYQNEREKLMSEFFQKTRRKRGNNENSEFDVSNLSDTEARKLVNDRAKMIDLEKKFHNDLTKLFSPQRVLTFYDAERSFQRELINVRNRNEGDGRERPRLPRRHND